MALRRLSRPLFGGIQGLRALCSGSPASSHLGLTPEQVDFKNMATEFAAEQIMPHAARWDAEHHFPVDQLRAAAELGFAGLFASEEYGGTALSRSDGAVIFETLAYADVSYTAYLTIHNMVAGVLNRWAVNCPGQTASAAPRLVPTAVQTSASASRNDFGV
jgi:alkylation response protein AidB-like acyl-CoA dehydrogenase